ncbi:EAL domain-containing protein [Shewanella sp. YIC-542]|uniref:EAL domain-containing protein n=1 Tax=Shewanella mytili TaxID=3377111 RepID=UPI00398E760A
MATDMVLPLVQNIALLLALVLVYDVLPLWRNGGRYSLGWQLLSGVLIGGICMVVMLTPWTFSPGVFFDGRSVLLCLAGLFFGGLPTVVACMAVTVFRFYLGGDGEFIGIGVIWSSGLLGIAWRQWRHWNRQSLSHIGYSELIVFALLVHVAMLLWMLLFPATLAVDVISQISLPVLLVLPAVTVLMGKLLSRRLEREIAQQLKLQDDFLFRSQFNVGNYGISISSPERRFLKVNPHFCRMLGYSEDELLHKNWDSLTHPDDIDENMHNFNQMVQGHIDRFEQEKRFVKKNGQVLYTHVTVSCQRSFHQVQLVIAGYIDITAAKEAQQALAVSHAELELVLASSQLGYWVWDLKSDRIISDQLSAEMLGCPLTELNRDKYTWIDAIMDDDRLDTLHAMEQHIAGGSAIYHKEYRIKRADGGVRWIRDVGKVMEREDEQPVKMCGIHQDITREKQREISLKLAASVYENSSEAMSVLNRRGKIINVNPAFCAIMGYREEDIIGRNISVLRSERYSSADFLAIKKEIGQHKRWQGELWLRRHDGNEIITWLTVNTIDSKKGEPQQWVALFSNITEKKHSEQVIWHQANYDQLTGLPNRRMLLEQLYHEIQRAHRRQGKLALLFLDLDLFKEVNDTLGHDMGDLLLIQTAARLRECVRESDFVARLGGDEFTIILTDEINSQGIERVAGKILARIAEPYQLGEETAYISVSIGITVYPDDGDTEDVLLKHADQAMYAAKEQGRNRYHYFTESMQQLAHYRMRLIQDLRTAVENSAFQLSYQPIVEVKTGKVTKAEALIRWNHPQRGFVSPTEFIPVAEDTGLIFAIGNWVFQQVVQQNARWRERFGIEIQISINKSPVQFRDEGARFHEWLKVLQQLPGCGICIEITEGLLLDTNLAVSEKLLAYRDAGVQVSLDDFGTGYSSLAYLKKFDIDYLKIDQSFTKSIDSDASNQVLCEAIVVMAHKLGMKVIAEGVETAEQAAVLQQINCDYAQGYFYSRPVPADDFEHLYLLAEAATADSESP